MRVRAAVVVVGDGTASVKAQGGAANCLCASPGAPGSDAGCRVAPRANADANRSHNPTPRQRSVISSSTMRVYMARRPNLRRLFRRSYP
jgi:hypothetical protein